MHIIKLSFKIFSEGNNDKFELFEVVIKKIKGNDKENKSKKLEVRCFKKERDKGFNNEKEYNLCNVSSHEGIDFLEFL